MCFCTKLSRRKRQQQIKRCNQKEEENSCLTKIVDRVKELSRLTK